MKIIISNLFDIIEKTRKYSYDLATYAYSQSK